MKRQLGARSAALIVALSVLVVACGTNSATASDPTGQSQDGLSTYTKTKYPIVLVHGMSGFSSILGVLDYWYGISDALRSGGATVYVTQAAAFNSPELRGEEVLKQVEDIIARTGCKKVNLIGHSQGGLDVRYVAAVRPDLVASVTTVGTPHKGATLADFLRAHLTSGGFDEAVLATFANHFGFLLGILSGTERPQDAIAGLDALTTDGTAAFNQKYPNGIPRTACGSGASSVDGIRYYSWTGKGVVTNLLDASDAALLVSSVVYPGDNDGLVGRCSAHFGYVVRDSYNMNHLDEVNQILGLTDIFSTNPKSVFRSHASRLKRAGL